MQCFQAIKAKPVKAQILLAHGAGAGSDSDFMQNTAVLLAEQGMSTWLFDFPYMKRMRAEGKRRPPDRMPKLLAAFKEAIEEVAASTDFDPDIGLYIGGKSMGGRVATHLLTQDLLGEIEAQHAKNVIKGGIILGYPFRPLGKKILRVEHFNDIARPVIIGQGERDAFGGSELLAELELPTDISAVILPDGDHSFKPRKASGETLQGNMESMVSSLKEWMCH